MASLNIQRGRDHGLPSYNEARVTMGMPAVIDFTEISSDATVVANLASVYDHVDDIDLWVGGLAEDHMPGSLVGELFQKIISEQFERLRDGDRYYYKKYLTGHWKHWAEAQTLAKVIRRNTEIGNEISDQVFFAQ